MLARAFFAAMAIGLGFFGSGANAEPGAMRNVFPKDLQWQPAPSVADGAQFAIVNADATAGILIYRLRIPAGARLETAKHGDERWFTVLQGTFAIGAVDQADWNKLEEQTERNFFAVPANTSYYGVARTEVVLQIQTTEPALVP